MNNVTLIGRLTRDPEIRYLQNGGMATVRFSIAVNKQLSKDKKQEMEDKGQPTADFINIVAWGKIAETVSEYLKKGNRAGIVGRIQTGTYTAQDGSKKYTTEVVVNNLDLIDSKDNNNNSNTQPHTEITEEDFDHDEIPF